MAASLASLLDESVPHKIWDILLGDKNTSSNYVPFLKTGSDSPLFYKSCTIPLPSSVTEHISFSRGIMLGGIFPEINKAYITIDQQLFLWDANTCSDQSLVTLDSLDDSIIAVALVRPVSNVFVESVKYLLVLATLSQIVLVALVVTEDNFSMGITDYILSMDVRTTAIVGTNNGRIFISAADGCLYEIEYNVQVIF
eukprot:TRINITY_DN13068_c0_g1_i1.p1 TRINITY_DN13068_c0_g1~~TRINITY_DN13068_c0_g1_i1.p1  ORF type:complete len:197 (+),score=14.25 TRINITY_DN13068_c0_g1_i1:97-687(+)